MDPEAVKEAERHEKRAKKRRKKRKARKAVKEALDKERPENGWPDDPDEEEAGDDDE